MAFVEIPVDLPLLRNCLWSHRKSQKELYNLISSPMYTLCVRNSFNKEESEELFIRGFINLLNNLKTYKKEYVFENWCSEIFIDTINEFYKGEVIRILEKTLRK